MGRESDRVAGVLVGLAAGDRKGGPLRMAVRLADSLRLRGSFDLEDIGHRYLQWWIEGAFDTGRTTATVLELVQGGMSFEDASRQVDEETSHLTASCNPAHRVAPLAMLRALPDGDLAEAAIGEANLTHRHPVAGDVSAAVVVLCRALIRGLDWAEAVARASDGRLPDTRAALEIRNPDDLGRGAYAPDTLAAAIWFVGQARSFPEALTDGLSFAGPANFSPVLVGAMGGARWGESAIPEGATDHVGELMGTVRDLAHRLAAGW